MEREKLFGTTSGHYKGQISLEGKTTKVKKVYDKLMAYKDEKGVFNIPECSLEITRIGLFLKIGNLEITLRFAAFKFVNVGGISHNADQLKLSFQKRY